VPQGLPRKLRTVFTLQAVMASFAVVTGFYFAGAMVKETLETRRLHAEAESYWTGRANDPAYPLPRTSTLRGYFVPAHGSTEAATLPEAFRSLPVGIHKLSRQDRSTKVLVDQRPEGLLYIQASFRLVEQVVLWTGLVSLLLALLAIWIVSWFSYRRARRLVIPINRLAKDVAEWDPLHPAAHAIGEGQADAASTEMQQLSSALRDLAVRTQAFVRRERDFTRDASHELRTPLTVVRVATDLMHADPELPAHLRRSLQRIQRAGQDMEAVIDAFLILARENAVAPQVEDFEVRDVVNESVAKAREKLRGSAVAVEVVENATPKLHSAPRVLKVMLDNLLSNACTFTETGRIEVRIETGRLIVSDTGIGMTSETLQRVYDPFYRADQFGVGKGMGLSIVRRLGERFGWPVTLESTPGVGTTATIWFSGASG
jgi:signal transduction histidine kinase